MSCMYNSVGQDFDGVAPLAPLPLALPIVRVGPSGCKDIIARVTARHAYLCMFEELGHAFMNLEGKFL